MEFFGYEIKRKPSEELKVPQVVVSPSNNDGSALIESINAAGYYSAALDLDGAIKNESELVRRYRTISTYSECDSAIDEIINEMFVTQDGKSSVEISLDNSKLPDSIKTKISTEFKTILKLLDFNHDAYNIGRDAYIDGRIYAYPIINKDKPADGIIEIRHIDSRKIKKIKNIKKKRLSTGIDVISEIEEYYIYNDKGVTESTQTGIKLNKDSVVYCPMGYMDKNSGMLLGFLHKALKPATQLKYIEDSAVIYTITRAPMKRIFYIDVGTMPKHKAEQYVQDMMAKYRNKIVYDANTGEVKDDKKHSTILEDYWMPRREGGKGTEISTLEGSQSLLTDSQLEYFKNKLYQALNVPTSRLQGSQSLFGIGRSSEISREEIKFAKFIDRLRSKFSTLFNELLKLQLISKGIISPSDWEIIKSEIQYDYQKDNLYSELKEMDILNQRLSTLQIADNFVGKYFNGTWVQKHILRMSEEDIEDMNKEIVDSREQEIEYAKHQGAITAAKEGEIE